ncbi:DNA methyltransferase [Acidiphilium acidophilum]|uniref:DNA methyltransferase n=1 Tax=Acidiphilium acidophilum TaxID=76588 RepID=UPI002E8E72FC|nr:DNA methyltransferase [Acidiphilium acidophilum]
MERVTIGNAILHRADCRDVLDRIGPIDVILTDPVWPNCPAGLIPGSEDPYGLWRDTMNLLPRIRRLITVLRCDCDPRFLATVPDRLPFFRSIQLPFVMPLYIGRGLGGDELAHWFGAPVARGKGRNLVPGRGPLVQPVHRPPNGHPCSRAQRHFDWLVDWTSDPGEIICDPFLGSGTTGVACAKFGRRFIGIEIDPRYFDIACQRIEQTHSQGTLDLDQAVGDD